MCDYNCLECPFPDCIVDEISDEEILASEKFDKEIRASRSAPSSAAAKERAARWRKENPERYRQIQKNYRERHRDILRERARVNYKKKKASR